MTSNVLMGPFLQLIFQLGVFGLLLCGGCHMLGIMLVLSSKLFIAVAGQSGTTMCPALFLVRPVFCFILAHSTLVTCLIFATHLAFTMRSAFTMCPTFTTGLLSLITSSCPGMPVFVRCPIVHTGCGCPVMLPRGGILWVRLWRGLGPLVLLILQQRWLPLSHCLIKLSLALSIQVTY